MPLQEQYKKYTMKIDVQGRFQEPFRKPFGTVKLNNHIFTNLYSKKILLQGFFRTLFMS